MITVSPTAMIPTNAAAVRIALKLLHGQEAGRRRGAVDRHRREDRDPDGERDVGDAERPALDAERGPSWCSRRGPRRSRCWLVVMSARIADADASARGTTETIRPAKIVTTTSARSSTSSSSVEEKITAVPAAGGLANEVVDLGAPADVDAARRLVEGEQRRPLELERAAEQHLLLVAAAEARGRRARAGRAETPAMVASSRAARWIRRRSRTPSRLSRRSRATVRLRSTVCPRKRPSRWRSFGM